MYDYTYINMYMSHCFDIGWTWNAPTDIHFLDEWLLQKVCVCVCYIRTYKRMQIYVYKYMRLYIYMIMYMSRCFDIGWT